MKRDYVLLVGQESQAHSLAEGLCHAGLEVEVAPLDSLRHALTPATWKLIAEAAAVVRIGFRPGAKTWRGLAFDTVMRVFTRRGAKTCCYWIESDVLQFAEDTRRGARVGAWRSPAFSAHQHIVGSEALRRELEQAGIGATLVPIPSRTGDAPSAPPVLPERGMLEPDESTALWARHGCDNRRLFAELTSYLRQLSDSGSQQQPRLTYLTLQATTEGQAAHAHVHEIVKGLAENGWCVRLIEPHYGRKTPSVARRCVQFTRIQVSALWGLRRGDAFYMRSHFLAYPAALSARLLRVPVIQELNGPHFDAILAWPALRHVRKAVEWLGRSQLRMANAVITVTPQLINWIAEDARVAGAHLVSNGADIKRFQPGIAAPEGLPTRYAVFFGALAPWQGIAMAIQATMDENWPDDVALVVVGDGMLREQVELAADGNRVVYLGQRPHGEIASIVGNSVASLIPMPSVAHGHVANAPGRDHRVTGLAPLKLFESMACGVPVIASDLPGLAETVSASGCGIIVEPGNPTAIATAVATLANSAGVAKAMGDRGRQSAVREHSWKSRADDTDVILRSIGSPGPRERQSPASPNLRT